jgi:excisionase family DNA binding protein
MLPRSFYSPKEICEITGFSPATVARYLKDGLLPSTKIRRRVLIPASSIARLIAQAEDGSRVSDAPIGEAHK